MLSLSLYLQVLNISRSVVRMSAKAGLEEDDEKDLNVDSQEDEEWREETMLVEELSEESAVGSEKERAVGENSVKMQRKERLIMEVSCSMANPMTVVPGVLRLTSKYLYFEVCLEEKSGTDTEIDNYGPPMNLAQQQRAAARTRLKAKLEL